MRPTVRCSVEVRMPTSSGQLRPSRRQWTSPARMGWMVRAAGFLGGGHRPAAQQVVAAVVGLAQEGLGARVGAGGALRRRRREELEHPQGVRAVAEGVMPGVAAEEGGFAGQQALHLAGLRIGEDEHPAQHVVDDVGGEDGAELVRVAEGAARTAARRRADGCGRWRHRSSPRPRPPRRRPRGGG